MTALFSPPADLPQALKQAIDQEDQAAFAAIVVPMAEQGRGGRWVGVAILQVLTCDSLSPPGRLSFLERLLDEAIAPNPSPRPRFIEAALHQDDAACVELLAARGFRAGTRAHKGKLPNAMAARMIARGQWPATELLFPDLFENEAMVAELQATIWTQALSGHSYRHGAGFFRPEAVVRLDDYLLEQPGDVRKRVRMAIGGGLAEIADGAIWWADGGPTPFTSIPQARLGAAIACERGLVHLPYVFRRAAGKLHEAALRKLFEGCLAERACAQMENSTAQASGEQNRVRL